MRRSPSASALLIVLVIALIESVPVEALIWQPSTTPAMLDEALLIAFGILLLGAALTWYGTARPIETTLREKRRTLKSLFMSNPESIAVYDLEGGIVRGNAALADLLGRTTESLIGTHLESHVAPDHALEVQAAFDRAAAGEKVGLETVFTGTRRERIDVHCSLSPHMAGERIVGVFGVARDTSELNHARALATSQTERMAELLAVVDPARTSASRVHAALALLCRELRFEEAFVAEIAGDRGRLLIGDTAKPGGAIPVPVDALRQVMGVSGVVEIGDFGASVRSFAGIAVRTGPNATGVLGLTSSRSHPEPLDDSDRAFLRVVTSLVSLALENGRQHQREDQQTFYDALTGLPNRLLAIERLSDILGSQKWRGMHFAVHYIDLEGFKEINDDFGHAVGDGILRIAARRIGESISSLDLLARLGGDEFVVVQPLPDGDVHADRLARRILAAISQPFPLDGHAHQLGVSIGISISSNSGPDGLSLLQHADEALYRAKHEAENRLVFVPDLQPLAS